MEEQRMREVKNMAQVIRETVAGMKAEAAAAVSEFNSEVSNSKASIVKFKALTRELKEATKEVDAALGETGGSNFPTQEELSSSKPDNSSGGGKTATTTIDANGVFVNNDPKEPPGVDINGVRLNRP